jgi:hypothetical protein
MSKIRQVLWYRPVIPALGRKRQEDHEFQASLGYTVRSCVKNSKSRRRRRKRKRKKKEEKVEKRRRRWRRRWRKRRRRRRRNNNGTK